MTFRSSSDTYDRLGFRADEIYPFLEQHGVKLPRHNGPVEPANVRPTEPEFPEWKRVMSVLPYLSLSEAAHAFAGIDPHAAGYQSNDEDAEIYRWRTVVSRALYATDSVDRLEAESEGGDTPDWYIKPTNLAAWCARKGLPYPLPSAAPVPSTNIEAIAEIDRLQAEVSLLKAERAELANAPSNAANWMLPYKGRRQIPFADVAAILAGFEPIAPNEMWADDAWTKIIKWREALSDAIESGDIDTGPWRIGDDTEPPALFQSDMRTWCAKRGYIWPIPGLDPQSAIEGDEPVVAGNPALPAKLVLYEALLKEAKAETERVRTELIEENVRAEQDHAKERAELREQIDALVEAVDKYATRRTDDSPAPQFPEWMRRQIGLKRIALWDAAKILAGIAPSETLHPESEKSREVDEWHYALEDAIEAGEISTPRWNEIRCEQIALHADIRTWCAKRGYVWPVPDPNPRPSTNAEALAEIERLKIEIERLRIGEKELAELRTNADSAGRPGIGHDASHPEIERLMGLVPPQPVRLMEIAIAVQRRYWGDNWDADDPDTWTTQKDIWAWIQQTYPSLSKANRDAIEAVACPVDRSK